MRIRIQAFENILRQPIFWFDLKSSSPSNLTTRLARDAPLIKSVSKVVTPDASYCNILASMKIILNIS